MIDIKTIAGEQLVSVPILQDAVIHEELMASDYIVLAWSSEDGRELPVGAYIEYEGERYSLYEPYTPTMVSEGEYRYSPQFHSREEAWNKQPACVYTYEENGTTVKSREFDWTFVGSPADAMQIVKQAIKNEIGEDWSIVIADSLPATIEISSQTSSITSILSDIATQCETEYWVDKKENIIHLSKCEHGDAIVLEVGNNVGVPSVMSKGSEYFTRYYALGSTRNITQTAGNINGAVNKRLTLDPNVFPMGYKDIRGHYENDVFVSDLENGEIFSKVVLFDDIYPSSDLEIISVRARMKYRLDGGKKVRVGGTDENPVYDQYAIWYFKIKDFTFSEDSLIEGLPLSVHFKSGRLAGQEFELIYHAKAKRENTDGDVLPFDIEAGDFEIKFKESSGAIIPDIAYIVPQNADKITLFNVEMPSEYTAAAQQRLLEALDKVIAREHEDSNTYEVESNPIAFYEANMVISLGQKVSFVNGDKSLETRVLMVERRLDSPSEQKIRVGNDLIQGSTKELRANVESLNHNVDVLSAFNDLSKNIQDSYGRTQALINEAVASVLGIWSLDDDGNLVTEKQVIVKNNIIISGDTSTGGTGQDVPSGIDEAQLKEYLDTNKYITSDYAYSKEEVNRLIDDVNAGEIDLTNYYTKEETASEISNAIAGIEIPSLDGYATEQFVTDSITALNISQYATKASLETLQGEVDNIEAVLGMDEEAEGIINTWNEVKAFLDGYSSSDDLAAILSGMNADIATRALGSDLDALAVRVGVNESAIADNATNIRNAKGEIDGLKDNKADWGTTLAHYGITDAYTKTEVANELAKYLLLESANQTIKGNITIEGNLIVKGDTSSTARGTDSGTDGTLIGVIVNGTRYEDETNGMLDLSSLMNQYALATAIPTSLPASDVYAWAKKSSLALVDVPDLSSKYLPLSGGTLSGASAELLKLDSSNSSYNAILFKIGGVTKSEFGFAVGSCSYIYDYTSGKYIGVDVSGTPFFGAISGAGKNTLIHSGNYSSYALPLSGGTITGGSRDYTPLIVKNANLSEVWIAFQDSVGTALIGSSHGVPSVFLGSGSNLTLIHSGNIGNQNAGSATKLQTARTIWGQSFDGTGNVTGNLRIPNNTALQFAFSNNAYANALLIDTANNFIIGAGTSASGANTYIGGNNLYLRYGTTSTIGFILNASGNVTFGASDLALSNYKLWVNGSVRVSNGTYSDILEFDNNGGRITFWNGSYHVGTIEASKLILNAATKGNVLIGTTTDNGAKLGIEGSMVNLLSLKRTMQGAGAFIDYHANNDSANQWRVGHDYGSSGSSFKFIKLNGTSEKTLMTIDSTGAVTMSSTLSVSGLLTANGNAVIKGDTSTGSDIRFKDKLSDHRIALSDIAEAPLFTFKWNDREDDSVHLGSSAQYWEGVAPWLVKGEDFKTLDYSTLGVAIGISLANKAVNHEERIKILEKENKALKEQIRRIQYGS